jgi:hypothetical protein
MTLCFLNGYTHMTTGVVGSATLLATTDCFAEFTLSGANVLALI